MKLKTTLLLLLSVLFTVSLSAQTYKVLFVGNSYTYVNNLPTTLNDLANSIGDTIIFDSSTPGGYTLEGHSTNTTTIEKINSQPWDFVILQDQSQRPSFPDSQVEVEVFPFAEDLSEIIRDNNECSMPLFFMTWGRKNGDQQHCEFWPPLCTYDGMQQLLRERYLQMGEDNNATVAPVGAAWRNKIELDINDDINLYSSDESHPSVAGTYLSACVFYATIFQKSPVGFSYHSTLSEADATFLQQVAVNTVLDSIDNWFINSYEPSSDFNYITDNGSVLFTNNSLNVDTYNWDFGDTQTSINENPIHEYSENGDYLVSLLARSSCGADTTTKLINIVITSLDDIENTDGISIYPMPNNGIFELKIDNALMKPNAKIELVNTKGSILYTNKVNLNENNKMQIKVNGVSSGVYLLRITTENESFVKRIVIQ